MDGGGPSYSLPQRIVLSVLHAVLTLQDGMQESCPVRVQFFLREKSDRDGCSDLQGSVNTWLRKLGRKGFRVVNQEVRMTTVTDPDTDELAEYPTIVIAIWYEKERKEVP